MKTLMVAAIVLSAMGIAYGQEVVPIPSVTEAMANKSNTPTWQAVCGYKWRAYRAATGAAGRDAYIAFMRAPSAEGGCGAGENRQTRVNTNRPHDDAIKAWLDANPPKVPQAQ
jgi:hypothetical protein